MKRCLAFFVAIVLLLGTFAACSKSDVKEPDTGNQPSIPDNKDKEVRTYDTPEQEALVAVAEAYYARRAAIQYEDGRLVETSSALSTILRADRHKYSPEDATKQYTIYSNCAAFTYDVYKEALGLDIVCWTTTMLQNATDMHVLTCNQKLKTQEERDEWKQKIIDTLQPGDLVNYRTSDWGHVMMYIGYGEFIHCSSNFGAGGSYNFSSKTDVLEGAGGIYRMTISELFGKQNILEANQFAIVRPLIKYTDATVTEKTQNRVKNLKDIYVEKLTSHPVGFTADLGDQITYSFYIRNSRNEQAELEVIDTVPSGTTYVSGAEKVEGNTLKWNAVIPAGGNITLSYTVQVNNDPSLYNGGYIFSQSTVGGVDVRCRYVYVAPALNAEEQAAIKAQAQNVSASGAKGIALAKEIYKAAGLDIDIGSESEIISDLFTQHKRSAQHYELNTAGKYMKMLVPTMYGGRYTVTDTGLYEGFRTKGPLASQLMVGDIIICEEKGQYTTYMFTGDNKALALDGNKVGMLDIMGTRDALLSTLGYYRFVIIRPAMGL